MNHRIRLFIFEKNHLPTNPNNKKAFTLLELIIVIIIVGILATLGLSQYTTIVEGSRLGEAKAKIGAMRKLALEYYLKNGTATGITNTDLGVTNTCSGESYFRFLKGTNDATWVRCCSVRCTANGKSPNAPNPYIVYLRMNVDSGVLEWYKDNTYSENPCTDCTSTGASSYCP